MFRHPSEIKSLLQRYNPDSVLIKAEADLPRSLEFLLEADGVNIGPTFEAEGWIRESPLAFESSGSVTIGRRNPEETHELSIEEREDGFALRGSHLIPADSRLAAFVVSEEGLDGTLTEGLSSVSPSLGSQLTVDVESHEARRRDDGVVDSEYVARLSEFRGHASKGNSENMSVKEAAVDISRGEETVCSWVFDLQNHRDLFSEILADRGYRRAYELSEQRRESGFGVESRWRAKNSGGEVSVEINYGADNASVYMDELRQRSIKTPARTSFNVGLNTRGSTTSASIEFETDGNLDARLDERLESWVGFVPLPLAPLVSYIS
jgi:hypothetical protein